VVSVLHLKRFSSTLHKLSQHVVFSDVLVLPSAVLHGWSGGSGGVRYRLCGVLVHHGATVASGHYTSFVRYRGAEGGVGEGASECWVSIDDSRVSVVSASTVLAQQAYMLFYSRM
jgi:ubiquitin C-terminal hydrolase